MRCRFCKERLPAPMPTLPPMDFRRLPEGVRRKRREVRMAEVANAENHAKAACTSKEDEKEWLTTWQVAEQIGKGPYWVRRRIAQRRVSAWRDWRGRWRIHVNEVRKIRLDLAFQQSGEM